MGLFLKCTREELQKIIHRTRKLMTMCKALHPRDDINRLYVLSKEGGRGLASIEDYIKKLKKANQSKHKQHKDQQNNNYMDISSDKQVKSKMRRFGWFGLVCWVLWHIDLCRLF